MAGWPIGSAAERRARLASRHLLARTWLGPQRVTPRFRTPLERELSPR